MTGMDMEATFDRSSRHQIATSAPMAPSIATTAHRMTDSRIVLASLSVRLRLIFPPLPVLVREVA